MKEYFNYLQVKWICMHTKLLTLFIQTYFMPPILALILECVLIININLWLINNRIKFYLIIKIWTKINKKDMPIYKITKSDLEAKVIPEIWCQLSNYNPRQNIDFQWSWSITCMYRNNDLPYQQKKHVCMYCIILYSKREQLGLYSFNM